MRRPSSTCVTTALQSQPFKPPGYIFQRATLLVGFDHKSLNSLCFRRMFGKHRKALSDPIAAMRDERHKGLAREIMTGKEGSDHRRRGHSPDRKSQEDHVVRGKVR